MDQGPRQEDGRIIQQELGLEGIGPIDDQVVPRHQPAGIRGSEILHHRVELDGWVERVEPIVGGLNLEPALIAVLIEDLPVEVRGFDPLVVEQSDAADARGREVERDRRTERAQSHNQDRGVLQPALPRRVDLGQNPLPLMADVHHRAADATNAS